MIVGADGKPVASTRQPCPTCGATKHRTLNTGFGGYWSVSCAACGAEISAGRGDPPAEGEY
jgi:endogenous inhibitor of DNA gyrase (YacG/DUF329 family)